MCNFCLQPLNLDDQHVQFLTPSFTLSGLLPPAVPSYENMKPDELEALLTEMEQDIHAADRDMQEIEVLESKGVTSAGKLTRKCTSCINVLFTDKAGCPVEYEVLKPRLVELIKAHEEDMRLAAFLERRIALLMERHAIHVWNSHSAVLTEH
jgi:hypothetical protein